jgi:hypothetical protein
MHQKIVSMLDVHPSLLTFSFSPLLLAALPPASKFSISGQTRSFYMQAMGYIGKAQ